MDFHAFTSIEEGKQIKEPKVEKDEKKEIIENRDHSGICMEL